MFQKGLSKSTYQNVELLTKLAQVKNFYLAAMKLEAISGRGRKRDFIDLFFLAKQIPLEQTLKLYEKKYKALSNNLRHLLNSLVYFDDADEDDMPKMLKKVSWEEVKKFFQTQTIKLAKDKLKI